MADTKIATLAAALAIISGCGSSSPTSPTQARTVAVADAVQPGSWKGTFEITSCTATSGTCSGSPESFVLRLQESGVGVLVVGTSSRIPADVFATQVNGTTVVRGSSRTAAMSFEIELRLTQVSDALQGTAHYIVTSIYSGQTVRDARILFASRDNSVYTGRFQGEWVGLGGRTECTGNCDYLDPLFYYVNSLVLSQVGTTISGTFNGAPVRGSSDGVTLKVAGYSLPFQSSCASIYDGPTGCVTELTLTATVDKLERLRGSVAYRVDGKIGYKAPYSFTASGTLDNLVRWP